MLIVLLASRASHRTPWSTDLLQAPSTRQAMPADQPAAISATARPKPEAAYFSTEGGTRTSYMFFDLDDPVMMIH